MRVDFSISAVYVPSGTAKRAYQTAQGYYYVPDCDLAEMPLPSGGLVEDYPTPPLTSPFSGYNCSGFSNGDDCHILLVAPGESRLYELYHGTVDSGGNFSGGCLAIWNLNMTDPNGRGQQCTSADAAGFPMSALLFSADEIKAGHIDHAIRFILPNSMIRAKQYVMPATHGTNTTGPATSGPYGFRMRLKASYPISNLSPAAQVVARALQKYGMLMSDGGTIALTAQNDALSNVKWTDVGFDTNSLSVLKATDFEVVDYGTPITVNGNCNRQQILEP
jgi:serine/threonine-protein kinase